MKKNLLAGAKTAPPAQALPMPSPSDPVATAIGAATSTLAEASRQGAQIIAAALANRGSFEFVIKRDADGRAVAVIARPL